MLFSDIFANGILLVDVALLITVTSTRTENEHDTSIQLCILCVSGSFEHIILA